MRKLLLVDRDGTILVEPDDEQIDSLEKLAFVDGAILALKALQDAGWRLILVSNQDGLGSQSFPSDAFMKPQALMLQVLASCGIKFQDVLICPHFPEDECICRKPKTGLLRSLIEEGFSRSHSAVVGDRESDLKLAEALGVKGFRIGPQLLWSKVVESLLTEPRQAELVRKTRETTISVSLNLDSFQTPQIKTGSAFFDHMLEQIGFHAGIALTLEASGDWHVDDHHCIEDTALILGEALRKALGDKHGIARYGFVLPMDESLAECSIDLSGRPFCKYSAPFTRESVGGLATEMIPHFFRSLADGLRAAVHISITGENNHHLVEAGFKAFGRCLGQAIQIKSSLIPSSKGLL